MIPTPPHTIEQPSGYYSSPQWIQQSESVQYSNISLQKGYGLESEEALQRAFRSSRQTSSVSDEERNIMAAADSETRRIDQRIDSVDREAQLRLERAMAEVNGSLRVILERTDGMKTSIDALGSLKTTVVVTGIATGLAIVGAVFAGQALWGAGFASGQTDRPAATSAAK